MSIAIARQTARQLFAEAEPKLPVDLQALLSWRGLSLRFEDDWPPQLCARLFSEQRLIAVNASHYRCRQRFSIAHELGHFVLGHDQVDVDHRIETIFGDEEESFNVTGDVEKEANAFAVELLMPRAWVLGHAGTATRELVGLIQSTCDVSEPAAWYRVMELKLGEFGTSRRRRQR